MNEDIKTIKSFLKLLKQGNKYITPEIGNNLTSLQESLKNLANSNNVNDDTLAEAIIDWLQPYDDCKKFILAECQRKIVENEDEEISVNDERNLAEKVDNMTLIDMGIEEYQQKYLSTSQNQDNNQKK